jgi:hypothetical protein
MSDRNQQNNQYRETVRDEDKRDLSKVPEDLSDRDGLQQFAGVKTEGETSPYGTPYSDVPELPTQDPSLNSQPHTAPAPQPKNNDPQKTSALIAVRGASARDAQAGVDASVVLFANGIIEQAIEEEGPWPDQLGLLTEELRTGLWVWEGTGRKLDVNDLESRERDEDGGIVEALNTFWDFDGQFRELNPVEWDSLQMGRNPMRDSAILRP